MKDSPGLPSWGVRSSEARMRMHLVASDTLSSNSCRLGKGAKMGTRVYKVTEEWRGQSVQVYQQAP